MRRGGKRAALVVGVLAGVAGCSGGSGTHPPTGTSSTLSSSTLSSSTPISSATSPATSSPATSRATATTSPTSSVTPSPAPTTTAIPTIPIPKVAPYAQAAVNSYVGYLQAAYFVEADPGEIRRGTMNAFLGGQARKSINASLDALGKSGIGYRGNPPTPHVRILSVPSRNVITMTSCALPAKTNPYRQVVIATNRPVAVSDREPRPPYLRTLTEFYTVKKHWVLIKFSDDTSRTCTG